LNPTPAILKTNSPTVVASPANSNKGNLSAVPAAVSPTTASVSNRANERPRSSTTTAIAAASANPPGGTGTQPRPAAKPFELVPITTSANTSPPNNRPAELTKTTPVAPNLATTPGGPPVPSAATPPATAANPATNREQPGLEPGQVRDSVVVRPAQDLGTSHSTSSATPVASSEGAPTVRGSAETTPPPAKKGFFSRLNPFGRSGRGSNEVETASKTDSGTRDLVRPEGLPEVAPSVSRYAYLSPARPANGNVAAASVEFKRGVKAQKAGNRVQAAADYQAALRSDPGHFDAYYNLGLLALDSGDARLSLWAYEIALAIQPDSADARYNLSLALKAGGYSLDASDQLGIILKQSPDDARAHLSLANLCAQQLRQPRRAREHYLRVLELNPKHPDAATIRYWLAANP